MDPKVLLAALFSAFGLQGCYDGEPFHLSEGGKTFSCTSTKDYCDDRAKKWKAAVFKCTRAGPECEGDAEMCKAINEAQDCEAKSMLLQLKDVGDYDEDEVQNKPVGAHIHDSRLSSLVQSAAAESFFQRTSVR